jgi:putative radical SAM enzyme (TIGR03279 family)
MVRIAEIHPGTIADDLALEIGSRIVRINGEAVRDTVDFRFMEADGTVEIEVSAGDGSDSTVYEIEKDPGERLGIVPAQDPVRQCSNKCVFCFIDGNPAGARRALHLKDDDFRLSFTYGSYVTLTNLGPRGFQRLIDQRLSPLYVSVHATDPAMRMALLGVPRGGDILADLARLIDGGIEVHTQVVLCPGWNDGLQLERTIDELWALGDAVLSLSIVPVGLTRYNIDRPVRLLEAAEAAAAIDAIDHGRRRALDERGTGWVYAADEMFFIAGRAMPPSAYYDDWPLTENGVGAVRALLDGFEAGLKKLPRLDGRRIAVVTGTRMGPVLDPLVGRVRDLRGANAEVVAVTNEYFGPTVTTAGLLPGADIINAVASRGRFDDILIPAEALNDNDRFIDDMPLASVEEALAPARVVRGYELATALRDL